MRLILGGFAQGKLALANANLKNVLVYDETNYRELLKDPDDVPNPKDASALTNSTDLKTEPSAEESAGAGVILNHFHLIVRDAMKQGRQQELEEQLHQVILRYPDLTIISDEIGNGIVPMDAFERSWREETGRELIRLAERAEIVIRVVAGIGQKIK